MADYIAEQLNGRDALGYSVSTTGKNVTLSKDGQDVATGSVNDGGKIVWGTVSPATPVNPGEYTGNLTETELGILSTNKMAELTTDEIDGDANLTSDQKTALKDTTKVKAVLTGNVPVPVEYEYIGGTSTAIQTSNDVEPGTNGWGVVIKDSNDNEWVWVPVNSNESVSSEDMWDPADDVNVGLNNNKKTYTNVLAKINGVKLASINGLNGLKIAESSSSSEESEESEVQEAVNKTTTKRGASNIIGEVTRGEPNNTSSYREPALTTDYDVYKSYYSQAGDFESANDFATAMVNDYNAMITSITKYGGFYVGRYELSGTNNGWSSQITNPKVQSGQSPMDSVNWYRLYQACRTFGDNTTTTSTMIWGTQWDLVCKWTSKKGNKISYDSSQSNRHSNNYSATTGSNTNDLRNNIYDLEGSRMEWTQEAYNTYGRAYRGGGYYSDDYAADRRQLSIRQQRQFGVSSHTLY